MRILWVVFFGSFILIHNWLALWGGNRNWCRFLHFGELLVMPFSISTHQPLAQNLQTTQMLKIFNESHSSNLENFPLNLPAKSSNSLMNFYLYIIQALSFNIYYEKVFWSDDFHTKNIMKNLIIKGNFSKLYLCKYVFSSSL